MLILLAAGFMIFYTWPLLQVNDQLHGLLERRLTALAGERSHLDAVKVQWSVVMLLGLDIPVTQNVTLSIDTVRVAVNPVRYLTSGLRLRRLISSIHCYQPHIYWQPFDESKEIQKPAQDTTKIELSTVLQLFRPWSDRFLLVWERGNVITHVNGDTLELVPEFRGILRGEGESISMDILGRCLAENDNLALVFMADIPTQVLHGELHLDNAEMSEPLHLPGKIPLDLTLTNLSTQMSVIWDTTGIAISGNGTLEKLSTAVDTYFVAEIPNVAWTVTDTGISLSPGTIHLPEIEAHYSGNIKSFLSPELDLSIQISQTSVVRIASLLPWRQVEHLQGKVESVIAITGPFDHIQINTTLTSPALKWHDWLARGLRIECDGVPPRWSLDFAANNLLNSQIQGTAELNFEQKPPIISASITAEGPFLRRWIPDAPSLILQGSGTLSGRVAAWQGELIRGSQPPANLTLSWQDSVIVALVEQPGNYTASAEIDLLTHQPHFNISSQNANQLALSLLDRRILPQDWDLNATLSGCLEDLNYDLEFLNDRNAWTINSTGIFNLETPKSAQIRGEIALIDFSYLPQLTGEYRLEWVDDLLLIRSLTLEDYLKSTGRITLKPLEFQNIEISVNRLNLADLTPNVPFFRKRSMGGIINAEFRGEGTDTTFQWNGNLQWFDGVVAGLHDLWGNLSLSGIGSNIQIQEFQLGHGIELFAYAEGTVDIPNDSVALSAFARTNTMELFESAFWGEPTYKITGNTDMDVSVSGSPNHPVVDTRLGMYQGKIFGFPYESIEVFAQDLLQAYPEGILTVDSLIAHISPDFHIIGNGTIPVRTDGEFDCDIQGSGDFVAIFGAITPFFRVATGSGKIVMHLGGNLKQPRIDQGEIGIREGRMVMNGLFRKVEDINIDLKIQPDGYVAVDRWEYTTNDTYMRWRNYPELRIESGLLEPIYSQSLDLNLGIWVLDEVSGPMRLNLPGFMKPAWDGNLDLSGRVEGEKFLVAGPGDSLLIRGNVTLSNATMTFPFIKASNPPSPFVRAVLKTLKNAHWDLNIDVDPGVQYSREIAQTQDTPIIGVISGWFNRITTDLTIDPETSSLLFQQPDSTFIIEGKMESTRGNVEFLDMDFEVEKIALEFDRFDPRPWVAGRAYTYTEDSLGFTYNVYLTFYTVDSLTGERLLRGRWGDFTLVLEDDQGRSQEEILEMMGYSLANLPGKVTDLGWTKVGEYVDSRLAKPVENVIKNFTGIDRVDINPRVIQNVLRSEIASTGQDTLNVNPGVRYLLGSRISVGKFLTRDIYLGYTGELAEHVEGISGGRMGLIHQWNLEYRMKPLSPYLVLDLTYEYDNLDRLSDQGILLRYSFRLP